MYNRISEFDLKNIDEICRKDATRTMSWKPLFKSMKDPGTQLVFNICKAIGAFFPRAGYCQGCFISLIRPSFILKNLFLI